MFSMFTIKTQRKPTYFSRWMNLVNNIEYQKIRVEGIDLER